MAATLEPRVERRDSTTSRRDVDGVESHVHGVETHVHGVEAHVHGVEAHVHGVEALVHGVEALVHGVEAHIHRVEALVHGIEAHIHRVEALVHGVEARQHLCFEAICACLQRADARKPAGHLGFDSPEAQVGRLMQREHRCENFVSVGHGPIVAYGRDRHVSWRCAAAHSRNAGDDAMLRFPMMLPPVLPLIVHLP